MTAEELKQYRSICAEIRELEEQRRTSAVLDSVTGSSPEHPYLQGTIRLEGVREDGLRLSGRLSRLRRQKAQIEHYIISIQDSELRRIFGYRYLWGKQQLSWQRIALKIGEYDESYPRRKHNKFLKRAENAEQDMV